MFLPNLFQSTLPRGERRGKGIFSGTYVSISIHAPTWGATWSGAFGPGTEGISIHAPTWGATRYGIHISKH